MLKKTTTALKSYFPLLLLLLLLFILRIPNFYEPYWYGDEAIYLAVGTGLRNGLRLYTEIIDHKTPLIYYLAMTPTQFQFRLLNLGWMLTTTTFFFFFAKKIFKKTWSVFVATLSFVILTTVPTLEGNIPNGELFVIGFVMTGGYLFSKTNHFADFLKNSSSGKLLPQKLSSLTLKNGASLFVAGVFIGLGILTKVPALLDFAAFLVISWFLFTNNFNLKKPISSFKNLFPTLLLKTIIFFVGVITPIIISILYYISLGSGQDYLDYGLLYNIRYSGSWQPNFPNQLIAKLFTLPGKTALLALFMLTLTFLRKHVTPRFQFLTAWLGLTFFATLLSNRPYPHYLMQVVPSFALLVGYGIDKCCLSPKKTKKNKSKPVEWAVFSLFIVVFVAVVKIINFSTYPTLDYYQRFFQLQSGKITKKEYDQSFNWLVKENYEVAKLIKKLKIEKMFIWGTNPMLYAQTRTVPTSRFTVSFHIKDFDDYDKTFAQIQKDEPHLIIVMNNETTPFPKLEKYLKDNYLPNTQYQSMTLYLRHAN